MNHIALIGMRGSGKTSVGRVVAANLGRAFVDCDEHIEQRAGISIRELFEQHGESGFRRLESEILAGLLGASNQVVSVGGGAVIAAENRRLLATRAICVWLRASPECLNQRISDDPRSTELRPALTSLPLLEELRQISLQRAPLYAEIARYVIDTDGLSVEQAAHAIVEAVSASR